MQALSKKLKKQKSKETMNTKKLVRKSSLCKTLDILKLSGIPPNMAQKHLLTLLHSSRKSIAMNGNGKEKRTS